MLIFSSLTFVFERDVASETEFHTMLDAYWWALITMTTVWYILMIDLCFGLGFILVCIILNYFYILYYFEYI